MDRLNVYPNERVGIPDFEAGAGGQLVQRDQVREGRVFLLPDGRATGSAATPSRVLGGFDFEAFTPSTVSTLTINRGRGIFPRITDDLQREFGLLVGDEGPDQQIIDFSPAASSSTQAVYVRATNTLGEFENRVFWNPGAPVEFVDSVATRKVASWQVKFQDAGASPPGNGEWVKIWEVVIDGGGLVASVTDYRHFYFEGDPAGSYASEWGDGADDRNTDRAAYGVMDNHLWAHLIRRQLTDIIGDGGHYKAIPSSLKQLHPLRDRFVTIDQPGGAGGDGTYATIGDAITALNAADGGTILLREGTYVITAAPATITKTINFLGVEDGVFIENQINADVFLLDFAAGADGSTVQGINFTEHATDSSEQQIKSVADNFLIERCEIKGEVALLGGSRVVVDQCALQGAVENDFSEDALRFGGIFSECTIRQSRISADNLSRANTVFLGSAAGDISFEDCAFNAGIFSGARLLNTATFDGDLVFSRCFFNTVHTTSAANIPIDLTSTGSTIFTNCKFNFQALGVWTYPVLSTFTATVGNSLVMQNCVMDFNNAVFTGMAAGIAPVYIDHQNCRFDGLRVYNVFMPNTADTGNEWFFFLVPRGGTSGSGAIKFHNCKLWDISGRVSGDMNMSLFGSNEALATGTLIFDGVSIDGSSKTYLSAADLGAILRIASPAAIRQTKITNCFWRGGSWAHAAHGVHGKALHMTNNTLSFPTTTAFETRIVSWTGTKTPGEDSHIIFCFNSITHGTISLNAVELFSALRVVAVGNIVENLGTSSPPGIRINSAGTGGGTGGGVFVGNNCDDGVGYLGGSTDDLPDPGSESTLNIQS